MNRRNSLFIILFALLVFTTQSSVANNLSQKYQQGRFITYEMFGAKLDGIHDDYEAIYKCHQYANEYQIDVMQRNGTIYIAGAHTIPIEIKTNTDIQGCSLIIDDTFINHSVYEIKEDEENELKPVECPINKEQFKMGSLCLPCLQDYRHAFFVINGSRTLGVRPTEQPLNYRNKECFTIMSDGILADGNLYCDYTEDYIDLKVKSTTTPSITVKLPVIEFRIKEVETTYTKIIMCKRNNTVIHLPRDIVYTDYPSNEESYSVENILSVRECYGVNIVGGNCENKGRLPNEKLQRTCYVVAIGLCSDIMIDNVTLYRGWGAMSTEFIKTISVKNSCLNRFDNHFGISNVTIDNCTFIGSNDCINVGYGNGDVVVNNIKWIYGKTSSVGYTSLLRLREDLRQCYRGRISIQNASIYSTKSDVNIDLINIYDESNVGNTTYIKEDNSIQSINLENIYIDKTVRSVRLLRTGFSDTSTPLIINSLYYRNVSHDGYTEFVRSVNNSKGDNDLLSIHSVALKDCYLPGLVDGYMSKAITVKRVVERDNVISHDFVFDKYCQRDNDK